MILPILWVFLAGTISLTAALSAFIVSRAFGRSAFRAICYAAATFTAAFTLILLALTFVESAGQHEYSPSRGGPLATDPSAIMNSDGGSLVRITSFRETHAHLVGYVPSRAHCHDQCDSGCYEKVGLGDGNGSTA